MNTPFNCIKANELTMIENYISDFVNDGEYGMRGEFAGVQAVLTPWNEAKERLFKLFGEQLIHTKSMQFEMNEEDLNRQMADLIYSDPFMTKMRSEYYAGTFDSSWRFIDNGWEIRETISTLFNSQFTYINNKVSWYDENITKISIRTTEDSKGIDLFPSSKPMKILGKLADMLGIEGYENFRIAHSQVLNQKYLTGDFSISIHPLDYMTMSDNECGWDSCMSWRNFGGYRQGTVEMMNSPKVIVAYINSKVPYDIWGGSWSNKKWRCLFIVDDNFICKVKSYPYQNAEFEQKVIEWIAELAKENLGVEYDADIQKWNGRDDLFYNDERYKVYMRTGHMYNDFGSCDHYITFKKDFWDERNSIELVYSGESQCMWCGTIGGMANDEDLACESCLDKHYCYECGDRIYDGDVYRDDLGNEYCRCCYNDYVVEDPATGRQINRNQAYPVYIVPSTSEFIEQYKEALIHTNNDFVSLLNRTNIDPEHSVIYLEDFYNLDKVAKDKRMVNVKWDYRYYSRDFYVIGLDDLLLKEVKDNIIYDEWDWCEDEIEENIKEFEELFDTAVRMYLNPTWHRLLPGYEPPKEEEIKPFKCVYLDNNGNEVDLSNIYININRGEWTATETPAGVYFS